MANAPQPDSARTMRAFGSIGAGRSGSGTEKRIEAIGC
jgi:hypothetical protein